MAVTYQQLQNATLDQIKADPNLLKAYTNLYGFGSADPNSLLGSYTSGQRNFETDKQYVLGNVNELFRVANNQLYRYSNWNDPSTQAAANAERQKGLDELNQIIPRLQGYGFDPNSFADVAKLQQGFGATPGGGITAVQAAQGQGNPVSIAAAGGNQTGWVDPATGQPTPTGVGVPAANYQGSGNASQQASLGVLLTPSTFNTYRSQFGVTPETENQYFNKQWNQSTGVYDYFLKPNIQQLINSGATTAQIKQIASAQGSGNTSNIGLPNDLSGILGVNAPGTTSFDIESLTNNPSNLASILSQSGLPDNISSIIAGLLSYDTKSSGLGDLENKLISLETSLGNEAADTEQALRNQGVYEAYNQVKQLNLQAAQLQAELSNFDAETQTGIANIGGQAIPTDLLRGQQGKYQQQRDLTRLSKASQLSGVLALSQAYQGNAELGLKLAQQAVDLKYAPITAQIQAVKDAIDIAKDDMDREDKKRTDILNVLLDYSKSQVEDQKKKEQDIMDLAVQAAANGAPISVVNQMKGAADAASAAQIGSQYLKGNLESIAGSGSGSSGGGFKWTNTQLANGADAAGITVDEFKQMDGQQQARYITGDLSKLQSGHLPYADLEKMKEEVTSAIVDDKTDVNDVISAIADDPSIPPADKQTLYNYAQQVAQNNQSLLGKVGSFFGNLLDNLGM